MEVVKGSSPGLVGRHGLHGALEAEKADEWKKHIPVGWVP